MERTDFPFYQILEQEIQEWKKFRRALRKEDQEIFDQLFENARLHAEAGGLALRPWPFETILVSILLEQEKGLAELREKIEGKERWERGGEGREGERSRSGGCFRDNSKNTVKKL